MKDRCRRKAVLLWAVTIFASWSGDDSRGGLRIVSGLQVVRGISGSDPDDNTVPVTRVVKLLTDMKDELEKDAVKDERMHREQGCWCDEHMQAKRESISSNEEHIGTMSQTIEENIAKSSTLTTEIKGKTTAVATGKASLKSMQAMRTQEHETFTAEEQELLEAVEALKAAIEVLNKHHSGQAGEAASFLEDQWQRPDVFRRLQAVATLWDDGRPGVPPRLAMLSRKVLSFMREPSAPYTGTNADLQANGVFRESYAAQSSGIFGVLTTMLEDFEENLKASRAHEEQTRTDHAQLFAAKAEELRLNQVSIADKTQKQAAADLVVAQTNEERSDANDSLSADKAYLSDMNTRCSLTDRDLQLRKEARQEEISAVNEALSVLTTDETREVFDKVFKTPAKPAKASFLQLSAVGGESLALDSFEKVHEAIDKLVTRLQEEELMESKRRDKCIADLHQGEVQFATEKGTGASLGTNVDRLTRQGSATNATVQEHESSISELVQALADANVSRVAESTAANQEFAEMKVAEDVLAKVLQQLRLTFTEPKPSPVLLEQAHAAGQAATAQRKGPDQMPGELEQYARNGRAESILQLLEHVLDRTKVLQEQNRKADTASRAAYFKFAEAAENALKIKRDNLVDLMAEKARLHGAIEQTQGELSGSAARLAAVTKSNADIHAGCDALLAGFEAAVSARQAEIGALGEAKAHLSGMVR